MDEFSLGAWDPSTETLPNMFGSALSFGTLQVPQAPNTVDTVVTNAVQSMQPVSQAGAQSWSGFWQDLTRGVVGYAVARDAAINGVSMQPVRNGVPVVQAVPVQRAQAGIPPMLLLLLGGAFLVLRK